VAFSKPTKIFFFFIYFLKVHLHEHHSTKIKSQKISQKTEEIKVFLTIFDGEDLMMEGSLQIMTNPDPGGPKTYRSGSTALTIWH
jgi:hypothetical protein